MSVKIDMDMPKSCEVCVLKRFSSSDQKSMFCGADNGYHRIYKTKRPKDCPLKECKEVALDKELVAKIICIGRNSWRGCTPGGPCALLKGGRCNTWTFCLDTAKYVIENLKECK